MHHSDLTEKVSGGTGRPKYTSTLGPGMVTHVLFESASGYAIFEVKLQDAVGSSTKAVQASLEDLGKFGKMVNLLSFSPFKSAAHALENANDISEGAHTWVFVACAFN